MSVLDGLRRACDINPNGIGTIDGDRRRTWTEFRDRVARLAGVLRMAGIERGDRVAILSLNRDTYLEYFYATPWAGALVVPLNTRLAAPELTVGVRTASSSLTPSVLVRAPASGLTDNGTPSVLPGVHTAISTFAA